MRRWPAVAIAVLTLFAILAIESVSAQNSPPNRSDKPRVRAITAFVRLDRNAYQQQVAETMQMLQRAKKAYEQRGYEVQSVRITTQPFPDVVRGLSEEQALAFFRAYDELAQRANFDPNIGPAMMGDGDPTTSVDLLAKVLSQTKTLEGSVIVAQKDGIHWNAVRATARLVKYVSEHSANGQGTFNFTATAMLDPYAPFFPGSYHTGAGRAFSVGLESANVVDRVFAGKAGQENSSDTTQRLTAELSKYAQECESIAQAIATETGWSYQGLDPTPAPGLDASIGTAIEKLTGKRFGSSGTMTAAAVITAAVKGVTVKRVGYAGLMLPVLEDGTLARRWSEGAYDLDSLLAYSAVCGTGLDTVPLPGDITEDQIARIIGDMATLAVKWNKPLSARLQPVPGKKPGDRTEYNNPFLTNAVVQPLR